MPVRIDAKREIGRQAKAIRFCGHCEVAAFSNILILTVLETTRRGAAHYVKNRSLDISWVLCCVAGSRQVRPG